MDACWTSHLHYYLVRRQTTTTDWNELKARLEQAGNELTAVQQMLDESPPQEGPRLSETVQLAGQVVSQSKAVTRSLRAAVALEA
jgi:hypothetical protein